MLVCQTQMLFLVKIQRLAFEAQVSILAWPIIVNYVVFCCSCKLRIETSLMKEEFSNTVDWIRPIIDAVLLTARGNIIHCILFILYCYALFSFIMTSGVMSDSKIHFHIIKFEVMSPVIL